MRTFDVVTTHTVSVVDVYGVDVLSIPLHDIVDFRIPVVGDLFVDKHSLQPFPVRVKWLHPTEPRLIVKPKTLTVFTFKETGEFRSPNKGERYQYQEGELPMIAGGDAAAYHGAKYKIFTLTETQEPVV